MNNKDQAYLVEKIRTQYTEKENTALDALKALDQKAKRPASIFTWVFGSVSTLVMGAGMSLIMTDIGETIGCAESLVPGLVLGLVGMAMAIVNYPIYKGILHQRQEEYADEVIALSDKILGN